MPFVGYLGEKVVSPYQVGTDATVKCPKCSGTMWVRREYRRDGNLVPRVFVHQEGANCSGESNAHLKLKSIAANSLETWLPEARVQLESQIGDTGRIADVVAHLPIEVVPYGKGIIIEAQVKNKSKNIRQVSGEYLNAGYSVYWSYLSDIEGNMISINEDRLWKVWPQGVSHPSPETVYHEYHAGRYMGGTAAIKATLPPEYIRTHGFDIASPHDAPHWTKLGSHWLKSDGRHIAWVNLLHGEQKYSFTLELWRKDRQEGVSDWISNIPVETSEDYQSLRDFVEKVTVAVDGNPEATGGHGIECQLSGRGGVSATLRYENEQIEVVRAGSKGNTRTAEIPLENDSVDSLSSLVSELGKHIQTLVSGSA